MYTTKVCTTHLSVRRLLVELETWCLPRVRQLRNLRLQTNLAPLVLLRSRDDREHRCGRHLDVRAMKCGGIDGSALCSARYIQRIAWPFNFVCHWRWLSKYRWLELSSSLSSDSAPRRCRSSWEITRQLQSCGGERGTMGGA